MATSSSNSPIVDTTATTIDIDAMNADGTPAHAVSAMVIDVEDNAPQPAPPEPNESSGITGGLVTTGGGGDFSSFLAPLKKDTFKQVVSDVEDKLKVVNQTLSMLDNLLENQGFDAILDEMLRSITLKTGELLNADRTSIFLFDEEKNELFTIVAKDEKGNALEIRIPADKGIAGEVATFRKVVNIPYDFYDDPRSTTAKAFDKKNGYRTYTMVAMPLENEETGELVAVVQLINKLQIDADREANLDDKIDLKGFTAEDEQVFKEFAPSIRLILESSKSFYAATQRQRAASALMNAVNSLSKSSLDLEDTLGKVMDQAKELMNADRSTLWLLDEEKGELWTKILIAGNLTEIRIPRSAGFAGMVAESGEPLLIPFDLYNDPRSETSKKTDQKTKYRTCSMLCMPVFNADERLIGVTQLINKKKQGEYPNYNPENWPEAPEQWKSSFNRNDLEFMRAFNIQAGVALQNAKLFDQVKQQQKMQEDILRSLTNGVISTDKNSHIIAANQRAKELLGLDQTELEGKLLPPLIRIKEGDFKKWFDAALAPKDNKERQQFYPDQTLILSGEDGEDVEQSVNLSINSMNDALDPTKVNGALVVMEDISDEKQVKSLMYRYMTPEVAESLLASGDTGLGGKRKEVSVLFSDIRSYTTLTEKLQAEEVVAMLNSYFEEMVDSVFRYGGTLDKYIGDALMAVFGSPAPLEDHAWCAMQTAVEMRYRLAEYNQKRKAQGLMEISIGIGIHSDVVVSGNIGSSKRMELTSIGDGVNLASRLEGTSKQYGTDIVISEKTYRNYADRVYVRELDNITVKGKSKPVTIYELLGIREETSVVGRPLTDKQEAVKTHYEQGRKHYLQPAHDKLSYNEILAVLEQLEELSESELKKVSYDETQMLSKMLAQVDREELIQLLGEATLKRMLEVDDLSRKTVTDTYWQTTLPEKVNELTPRQVKKLLQAKVCQFVGAEETRQMLAEEAQEMSSAQLRKFIDLARKPFAAKAKESFKQAQEEFQKVLKADPNNKASKLHIQRCMLYEDNPPDETWDGVWKLTEK
ncbi:MAG: GAF domain-containing protein [Roseofilum sp. SBFL]|uniref:GAF domain-containing protein n=1 Tax=unclassified Roseofilum TaxID=2620099 RepID=UPI001B151E4B|nr:MULTISPECIES: adenylate/guanylate cyclase domain-containing protein [unclassified Roseofilum]MBP0014471.1 GAF domain-containing protein [Roseofilum sp. SID3]MBP0024898.1 GAF domain-containing protein [Roseofilum sp. SID2]MBP0038101.1 GAF domain-containing protein [Roseofilum sp. SID1]MBP0043007.1 GAF domain-containing protein [Roseofilum sp. SBFL]